MKRKRPVVRERADDLIAERIAQIKMEHPFWAIGVYGRVYVTEKGFNVIRS